MPNKEVKVKSISQNQKKIRTAHQQLQEPQILVSSDEGAYRVSSSESRQRPRASFQKNFQYTSSGQAKGVYNTQPYSNQEWPEITGQLAIKGNKDIIADRMQTHGMLDKLATKSASNTKRGASNNLLS